MLLPGNSVMAFWNEITERAHREASIEASRILEGVAFEIIERT